jgi:hypothetical protein
MRYGYLAHYGIPGMRWGIRRSKQQLIVSRDHAEAKTLRTKKPEQLSNEDMRKLTARMQLERSYKDLSKKEVSAGRKIVGDILIASVSAVGTYYVTQGLKVAINKALEKVGVPK